MADVKEVALPCSASSAVDADADVLFRPRTTRNFGLVFSRSSMLIIMIVQVASAPPHCGPTHSLCDTHDDIGYAAISVPLRRREAHRA
eukprot:3518703-Rhodomonas_salina.6